jgi:hypothetical protein
METEEAISLEETLDVGHDHLISGAKTQAKTQVDTHVEVASKVTSSAKSASKVADGETAKVAARATVMIGTHEVDAAAVEAAKAKLHEVVTKIGTRHPQFLGEAEKVSTLVNEGTGTGYVAGGYLRLKKILLKVDDFENELKSEHQTKETERFNIIERCNKEADDMSQGMGKFMDDSTAKKEGALNTQGVINRKMTEIEESKARENGISMEETMGKTIRDTATDYQNYWVETEERHQVRNVLMQALWLVCTGFRKFRHTAYCTTLRKQPDYQEGAESKWTDEAGHDYQTSLSNSIKFGETMSPVWNQQKVADAEAANQLDGDVDMEKGFVNNRAPWGVDPVGSGGEEKEMTDEQMSSRLSFLIETSYTPQRVAGPIQGIISALQTGDEATQSSLVEALTNIDREEGQAQSAVDSEWYADMVAGMKLTNEAADSMDTEFKTQAELHSDITDLHKQMVDNQEVNERLEGQQENSVKESHVEASKCIFDKVEVEAILEVNEEELVNLMRLNSLLRFLVIGEKASCTGCTNENQGSCTWVTRGAEPTGTDADADAANKNCKNLEGDAVPCEYSNSGHNDFYSDRSKVFCACEYGYYGNYEQVSPNGVSISMNCPFMKCPGFGRIMYPKWSESPISALTVQNYPAIAVCSSVHGRTHGICDNAQGICTQCFRTDPQKDPTPENIETATMTESFPYHGGKRKCEHWMCPTGETILEADTFYYKPGTSEKSCSQHGKCHQDRYGYYDGRCVCEEPWYGHACHLKKCQAREGIWFPATSPNACNAKGTCLNTKGNSDKNLEIGECECSTRFHGIYCELKRCPGFDLKKVEAGEPTDGSCPDGTCDSESGACNCNGGGTACGRAPTDQCPTGCQFKPCAEECGGGRTNGRCDRISGECTCQENKLLNGPTCKKPKRCDEKAADWSQSMDKWGWSTCKHGYLLVGLKTDLQGTSDALYNLNQATCAKPCEGDGNEDIQISKYACYHENWWKKFDTAGGKYCRRNYFVAGLFRSHCNSLYCLEMAKCCQVKKSLWTACKWVTQSGWTERAGGIKVDNNDGFVVGFWRDGLHTLGGITELRVCTPIWWGIFDPTANR